MLKQVLLLPDPAYFKQILVYLYIKEFSYVYIHI